MSNEHPEEDSAGDGPNQVVQEGLTSTGPVQRSGFASAIHSISKYDPESEIGEKLESAVRQLDDDHPYTDIAVVYPYLSYLELKARPPTDQASFYRWDDEGMQQKAMLKLEALSLREELMHGERQRFGLARNLHVLKREQTKVLLDYLADDYSTTAAARTLQQLQWPFREILNSQKPIVEAVDKYLIDSVLSESTDNSESNQFLAETAEQYADIYDDADKESLVQFLQEELRLLRSDAEHPEQDGFEYTDTDVFHGLQTVEDQHNRSVAEAVADVTLDIPQIIRPVDNLGFDGQAIDTSELDLKQRFQDVRAALEELEDFDDLERSEIRTKLEQHLGETDDQTGLRTLQDTHLPLLDTPRKSIDSANSTEGYEAMQEAPSQLGRIITGSFRFIGNFGAVLYKHEDGSKNWLVNPWIGDSPVDSDFDVDTYGELWQLHFLCYRVIERTDWSVNRLLKILPQKDYGIDDLLFDEVEVGCPFCQRSRTDKCGGDVCACSDYMARINERYPELLKEWYKIEADQ